MGSAASTVPAGAKPYVRVYTNISVQTEPWQPDPPAFTDREPLIAAASAMPVSAAPAPAASPTKSPIEESWLEVCKSLDDAKVTKQSDKDLVIKRTGWKTIRIFVSSTFRDFQEEREVLVKEVFPELRVWCEERRLHLVECDLRWGIPKDTTTESTLRTCLGEIDRCYQDNVMPYFLNMTSNRIGWIPEPGEVPQNLVDEYRWVFGLSVTEMEIVHGAYRKDNPNSFFLIRDDDFIKDVPVSHRNIFLDEQPIAPKKIEKLRQKIRDRFPDYRIVPYGAKYAGVDSKTKKARLTLDEHFRVKVLDFFKDRISIQYPLLTTEENPDQRAREAHESFMKSRSELVLGRANIIKAISDYVDTGGSDTPLLILGGPGTGKSSIMAKAADEITARAMRNEIPGLDKKQKNQRWHVFSHFVGAVPGSTDLRSTLVRLLKEINVIDDTNMPSDMESTVQLACSALNSPGTPPVIIIIDALNQFDEEAASSSMVWVSRKLSPRVRCVFSMIHDTPPHKKLAARESKPTEIVVRPLSLAIRKDMVTEYLGRFNKRLDMDQMILLLSKKASENPLWLSIACEELRVSGQFRTLSENIDNLADGLLELLQQILDRFETEGGGALLVATLCLLEVSATGLLESELLTILADENSLKPPPPGGEKGDREKSEKEKAPRLTEKLPAYKWASVYRSLRPFLRPFGNSGEGRLDFYHRTLSKAVRKKYLRTGDAAEDSRVTSPEPGTEAPPGSEDNDAPVSALYRWWHAKLADYFQQSDNVDRKVEEYPYHLIKLKDYRRLETFITEWPTFDKLFEREHSSQLLFYWRKCGGKDRILEYYSEELQRLIEDKVLTEEALGQRYLQVAQFLVQSGEYVQSDDLGKRALEIEEKMGARPLKMAEIYSFMANLFDQRSKQHEFCSRDQAPEVLESMKYSKLAMEVWAKETDKKYKAILGVQYIKLAFAMASLSDCGGGEGYTPQQATEEGNEVIDKAIKYFKESGDNGNLAEAIMTKAVLCRYDKTNQIKFYEEALKLCLETYGRYHRLTGRINFNTAICYEDSRQYTKAYDLFKENFLINREVFGTDHVKYQRSRDLFDEPVYKRMRIQQADPDFDD